MKAISGVLLGYALILVFVGTAFSAGRDVSASGGASSSSRSEGTVEVGDVKPLQGQAQSAAEAEYTAEAEYGAKAAASLSEIRDRARSASAKTLAKVERKLIEISRQIDGEANMSGDIVVAGRVAPDFGLRSEVLAIEQAQLRAGMGELVIAHTLAANSKKNVTTTQLFTLQREGFSWAQIAHGLDLRVDDVAAAVTSEAHVAAGKALADGRPASIGSATRVSSNTNAGMGAGAGIQAGRSSVGASGAAGVAVNLRR